jgi:PEP-CTERM motif
MGGHDFSSLGVRLMKRTIALAVVGSAILCAAVRVNADTTVTVDPGATWLGFMNVSNLPSAGGAYQFGGSWGTADLVATFTGDVLCLGPNSIGDPDPYWYTPAGGPGSTGNKIMGANMYVQPDDGTFTNQTLTFTGNVLSDTLTSSVDPNGNGWTSVAFIKDFAPDYSSFNFSTVALTPGVFSISLATINDPARHVQYGFETIGPDVWITDAGQYGSIKVTGVPEPAALSLAGIAVIGMLGRRRRR